MKFKKHTGNNKKNGFYSLLSLSPNYEINAMNSVYRTKTTSKRYE